MLDHIGIEVADYERSKAFYRAALAPVGVGVVMEVHGWAGFGPPHKPMFWIRQSQATSPPIHIAFRSRKRALVDEFHRAALAAGGKDNGAPGVRAHYHANYYGAFVHDPDGNNVEVVCHEAPREEGVRGPILNIADVEFSPWGNGKGFAARLGAVAARLGAKKLGYRVVVVPPQKKAWPYHFHHVNEEMFFILEGHGLLRHAEREYPIEAGDVIAAPPGAAQAHQIVNTSDADLRYLAVSTMEQPEVAEYPDSGKFGVIVGAAPGLDPKLRTFALWGRKDVGTDYWEGED